MVTVDEVIGDCNCFTRSFKEDIVELLEDTIRNESKVLWKLKEGTPKFESIGKKQGEHEELLRYVRPIPICK